MILVIAPSNENSNSEFSNIFANLNEQEAGVKKDLQNNVNSLVNAFFEAIRQKKLPVELKKLIKLYDELKKKHKKNNLMRF